MIILSMKLKSKNNSNIFKVETDEGEFFLHSDVIVGRGISVGEVDKDLFYLAESESSSLIAYNLILKYIGSNIKTEKQIRDYLYRKEYKTDTINEVVDKLKEYNIIDDKQYADIYVRSNPNFSRRKLKVKLNTSGVKNDIVDDAVIDVDDFASALKHANKFLKNKEITKEIIEKLIRRLTYLGYTWGTISKVLNELKYGEEL